MNLERLHGGEKLFHKPKFYDLIHNMKTTINFGIDLGTTNSAIAQFDNGTITVFKNPINWKETLPSVVAFRKNRVVIGEKAREFLQKDPKNVVGGFKRKMGTSDTYPIAATGEKLSPIDLSAHILKELKNFVPDAPQIPAAVITIPASFDTMQSNATKKAGYQAGFQQVVLLQEPIAASLAYANETQEELAEKKWLVYDLGGGTFDVALVTIEDEDMRVIDHEGNNYLGGTDIDKSIIEKIIIPYLERQGTFANLEKELKSAKGKYNQLYNLLLYKAEEAKIVLTTAQEAEIEFETTDDTGTLLDIYFTISRVELNAIIDGFIQQTIDLMEQVLQKNKVNTEDISFILMIGGSTYIPAVREKLRQHFQVKINYETDPTTAVAKGAAYYAGMKLLQLPTTAESVTANEKQSDLDIRVAFSKVAKEEETVFIAELTGTIENRFYRITRLDGGYDSGLKPLTTTITEYLPLVENVHNQFSFKVYDHQNNVLATDVPTINITHGKFNIDGQPLPNDICLEVDAIEENTTFLEPVFKKNDILPVKKTIVKEISKFIGKDSTDELIINVLEGDVDNLPASNKTIGFIKIAGKDLERDLIKGSEVELTFEVSESRDLMVQVYLTLTGQEFENVFSPSETHVDLQEVHQELSNMEENLSGKTRQLERQEKYEQAGNLQEILAQIKALKKRINELDETDITDEKYQIDEEKRNIAKQVHVYFSQSVFRKILERYYNIKRNTRIGLALSQEALPEDKEQFEAIIANEKQYLATTSVPVIKMKISQIEGIIQRVNSRRQITNADIISYFSSLKNHPYIEKSKADALIIKGESALAKENYGVLSDVVNQLYFLQKAEEKNDPDTFKRKGTGLQ